MKTGEKGLCRDGRGVEHYQGGRGVEHYQINVVSQNDPLNLKNGVIATQRSLDPPFCHTSSVSPVKIGEKVYTGQYRRRALSN